MKRTLLFTFVMVFLLVPPTIGQAEVEIKELEGTGSITNEKGEEFAKGAYQLVDGWIALPGIKGARFKLLSSDLTSPIKIKKGDGIHDKTATVSISKDDYCTLEDNNFFFLHATSSGRLIGDYSSTFARNTRFLLPAKKSIRLWENTVVAGEGGGEVTVRGGVIVDKRNVQIKKVAP